MNAADVKDALRARHPAVIQNGPTKWAGAWTCLEEWLNIDLLAVSAWSSVRPYPPNARIGYEIKVSRSDYRRELARPAKRAIGVRFCHEFYFAVPRGLLKPEEIAWTPPWGFDEETAPFERIRCPGFYGAWCHAGEVTFGTRAIADGYASYARRYTVECPTCQGRGWIAESPATRADAPKLWVPDDVGLVLVEETGKTIVAKKAPRRNVYANRYEPSPAVEFSDFTFGQFVRWVSVRPDPRHADLRAVPPETALSSEE